MMRLSAITDTKADIEKLKNMGHSEEAAELEEMLEVTKIGKAVKELQNVREIDDETYDKAITDTKAEIEKLKNMGHSEEVAKRQRSWRRCWR